MESKKLKAKDLINVRYLYRYLPCHFLCRGDAQCNPGAVSVSLYPDPADLRHSVHAVPDENG